MADMCFCVDIYISSEVLIDNSWFRKRYISMIVNRGTLISDRSENHMVSAGNISKKTRMSFVCRLYNSISGNFTTKSREIKPDFPAGKLCFSGRKSFFSGRKSSFLGRKSSFLGRKSMFFGRKSTFFGRKSTFFGRKSTFCGRKLTFPGRKSSFLRGKSSFSAR
jgi:hypothetical protein